MDSGFKLTETKVTNFNSTGNSPNYSVMAEEFQDLVKSKVNSHLKARDYHELDVHLSVFPYVDRLSDSVVDKLRKRIHLCGK